MLCIGRFTNFPRKTNQRLTSVTTQKNGVMQRILKRGLGDSLHNSVQKQAAAPVQLAGAAMFLVSSSGALRAMYVARRFVFPSAIAPNLALQRTASPLAELVR